VVFRETTQARLKVLLLIVVVVTGAASAVWFLEKRNRAQLQASALEHAPQSGGGSISAPPPGTPEPSPTPSPAALLTSPTPQGAAAIAEAATPTPESLQPPAQNPSNVESFVGTLKLIIPVAGVRADQLLDTFSDARSEGRVHDAIDIPAPAGTPVLAAADGEIVRLFQSERGGTTIYQLSADRKLIYYYAHLQRYADGLAAGKFARQGEVIAYVGDTGNAGAGNFHLHFSIAVVSDPKRYWDGTNINPYPLLRR
jgi:murein DD-endopeptidase MepM/ murein hydrolase activator NlpD